MGREESVSGEISGICVCHRRGLASGDAPSGDLNTEARGLTSEMKFIIALSGSLIEVFSLSCFEGVSLGSFEVSARRTRFRARVQEKLEHKMDANKFKKV